MESIIISNEDSIHLWSRTIPLIICCHCYCLLLLFFVNTDMKYRNEISGSSYSSNTITNAMGFCLFFFLFSNNNLNTRFHLSIVTYWHLYS